MSKIVFHAKSLSDNINDFCKSYEDLPDKERPIIIMTLEEFAKNAHTKMNSPLSIVSSVIGVMSLFNKDITITIPWDKSIYNALKGYDVDDVDYEIWVSEDNEIKIDNEELQVIDKPLTVDLFKDKINIIDVMYIMCNKTLKSLSSHKNQVRETRINQDEMINTFNIREHMTKHSEINLNIPQLYSTTWNDFMSMIVHFVDANKDRTKFICIESLEDDDTFIQLMNNMFKPYINSIHIINAHASCIKSVRLD